MVGERFHYPPPILHLPSWLRDVRDLLVHVADLVAVALLDLGVHRHDHAGHVASGFQGLW